LTGLDARLESVAPPEPALADYDALLGVKEPGR
jgi:hypothetical protein